MRGLRRSYREWRIARLRREARAIRRREDEINYQQSLPGGLFGTYWSGGIEGRDAARSQAIHNEIQAEDRIKELEAEADKLEETL